MRRQRLSILICLGILFFSQGLVVAQTVRCYVSSEFHPRDSQWFTNPWSASAWTNQLTRYPDLQLSDSPSEAITTISIDDTHTFQTVSGIGMDFDESFCYALQQGRSDSQIKAILARFIDPITGLGFTQFRICLGTSDFSDARSVSSDPHGWYSYQDDPSKPFSIENDRKLGIIRVIKLAQEVARENHVPVRFFGSAWSPPGWMKDSGSIAGGNLKPTMVDQYASYLVKTVLAYKAEGIPLIAITTGNEHYYSTSSYPSCSFDADTEGALVESLGTQLRAKHLATKVWILDHNWDIEPKAEQTLQWLKANTLNGEGYGYVGAVAFHHYGGQPTAMSVMRANYPDKKIEFTEGSVWGVAGIAEIVESFRNWAKSYTYWTAMVSQPTEDHIQGLYNKPGSLSPTLFIGSPISAGTINPAYYVTPEYYLIGQLSRFVRPGAVRIDSTSGNTVSVTHVAFKNPDRTIVVIVVNQSNQEQTFHLKKQRLQANSVLPASSVGTYVIEPK